MLDHLNKTARRANILWLVLMGIFLTSCELSAIRLVGVVQHHIINAQAKELTDRVTLRNQFGHRRNPWHSKNIASVTP